MNPFLRAFVVICFTLVIPCYSHLLIVEISYFSIYQGIFSSLFWIIFALITLVLSSSVLYCTTYHEPLDVFIALVQMLDPGSRKPGGNKRLAKGLRRKEQDIQTKKQRRPLPATSKISDDVRIVCWGELEPQCLMAMLRCGTCLSCWVLS